MSKHFLKTQESQLICFSISWKDKATFFQSLASTVQKNNNLIQSYLLPLFVGKRVFEPIVIKKGIQFVFFKVGDNLLLDVLNFLGGATSLGSFSKAYKTFERKSFTQIPPYETFKTFFSKLPSNIPLERTIQAFKISKMGA